MKLDAESACQRVVLMALLAILGAGTVRAGINERTSLGSESGQVWALAIDPQNPRTVYVGTSGGGVFAITFRP